MQTRQKIRVQDLNNLRGRYIIQLNEKDVNDLELTNKNISFYAEKRIGIVTVCHGDKDYQMSGIYYAHSKPLSSEEFVEEFNNPQSGRYYRLMTLEETIFLMKYLDSKWYKNTEKDN